MIWFVAANTSSCRIFEYDKKPKKLTLITDLYHGESKLKDSDLVSDRPGHYKSDGSSRGAFSPHEEPREVEIEHFSREIAKVLDTGRKANQYETLIIAIPPHMNGLLHQHLDIQVKNCIANNIIKDYTHLKETEILDALKRDIEH